MFDHRKEIGQWFRSALRAEGETPAGKLNLLGGLLFLFAFFVVLAEALLGNLGAGIAKILGKELHFPEWGPQQTIIALLLLVIYFILSVLIVARFPPVRRGR